MQGLAGGITKLFSAYAEVVPGGALRVEIVDALLRVCGGSSSMPQKRRMLLPSSPRMRR